MSERHTSMSANVVSFAKFLRQKNFLVTVEDESNALLALEHADINSEKLFYLCLQSIFCKNPTHLNQFKNLFSEYWKDRNQSVDSKVINKPEPKKPSVTEPLKSIQSWLNGNKSKEVEHTSSYSVHENLSHKDLSKVTPDQIGELLQIIKSMSRRIAGKISRRQKKSKHIGTLDLLKTIRRNIRNDSEMIHLIFRKPKRNRTKLVLLCDVSKSMELYSNFLIQFMYVLQNVFKRMETFIFSTKLVRITHLLSEMNFEDSKKLLGNEEGWSGGTKIGESLKYFLEHYSSYANKQTFIIILSDGWDDGDIGKIEAAMKGIHDRAKKTIWLNPLAGYVQYKPETRGMKAAMPYIDQFDSCHNIESLRNLPRHLN